MEENPPALFNLYLVYYYIKFRMSSTYSCFPRWDTLVIQSINILVKYSKNIQKQVKRS
jgi:hypothetical protein